MRFHLSGLDSSSADELPNPAFLHWRAVVLSAGLPRRALGRKTRAPVSGLLGPQPSTPRALQLPAQPPAGPCPFPQSA